MSHVVVDLDDGDEVFFIRYSWKRWRSYICAAVTSFFNRAAAYKIIGFGVKIDI